MARFVSTTSSGTPIDGGNGTYRGASLAELMAKQKMLSQRQGEMAGDYMKPIPSPWQGAAKLADTFVTGMQERRVEQETAAARERLAQIYAGADPMTGPSQAAIGEAYAIDPEAGQRMYESVLQLRQADLEYQRSRNDTAADYAQKRADEIADREDEQLAREELEGGKRTADAASKAIDNEMALRKEYSAQSEIKNYPIVKNALDRIGYGVSSDSAAGDMAIIYGFMKLQDPESAVREGEYATAENAGGISDRVTVLYNKVLNGERLSPDQRAMFLAQARGQYKTYVDMVGRQNTRYTDIAKASGIDPARVLITPEALPDGTDEKVIIDQGLAKARELIQRNPANRKAIKQDLIDAGYPPALVEGL